MRALLAALLLVPALALAQANGAKPSPVTHVVFGEDDLISGTVTHPDVSMIDAKRPTEFPNLITVRQNFNDKIRTEQIQ